MDINERTNQILLFSEFSDFTESEIENLMKEVHPTSVNTLETLEFDKDRLQDSVFFVTHGVLNVKDKNGVLNRNFGENSIFYSKTALEYKKLTKYPGITGTLQAGTTM